METKKISNQVFDTVTEAFKKITPAIVKEEKPALIVIGTVVNEDGVTASGFGAMAGQGKDLINAVVGIMENDPNVARVLREAVKKADSPCDCPACQIAEFLKRN